MSSLQTNIGLGNDFEPNREKLIIWTSDSLVI